MKTILVVDDDEAIRLLYEEELSEAGYRVILAKDAQEALEKLEETCPDLITLDIKMPGIDGIELLRKIRVVHRDLPIIISTAYDEYKQDFAVWASDAYITKSADLTELKAKIAELLAL
ncbi:MAG: response regulator [candidate division NC10 bacterium]|nr:response regulator [candidate division NC10 bacterium]